MGCFFFFFFFFFLRGFSLPGIYSSVLLSLHTWSLRVSFFLSWFRPFPLGSSSPLWVLTILLVSTLGLSFAYSFLLPLSSFFSPLGVSCHFMWVFRQVSPQSLLRMGLFSCFCHSVVLPLRLTRFSLPLSFRVRSFRGLWRSSSCVSFLTVPALRISLLLTLAVSFHSLSHFACPRSPVRSFSRASFFSL